VVTFRETVTKKTAIISIASALIFFGALMWLAKGSAVDPAAKHGPMELFGMGPELFSERAVAWVKGLSEIVKTGIGELGVIAAAVMLFIQNARSGRKFEEKINATKQEMAERFHNQGQRINDVALAVNPPTLPVETIDRPTVLKPADTPPAEN
jgi:hypothetical protein